MVPPAAAEPADILKRLAPLLLLAGCAAAPGCGDLPGTPQVTAELFMGGDVSDSDWGRFLDEEVTPRFPAGLTVLPAEGQWRTSAGRQVKEHSRLLLIVMPRGDVAGVVSVAEAYKRRFAQQSVGIAFAQVCAAF